MGSALYVTESFRPYPNPVRKRRLRDLFRQGSEAEEVGGRCRQCDIAKDAEAVPNVARGQLQARMFFDSNRYPDRDAERRGHSGIQESVRDLNYDVRVRNRS